MATLQIRLMTLNDVYRVKLREWEREAVGDVDFQTALKRSYFGSEEAIAVEVDGTLVLLIGHSSRSIFHGSGNAWMFASAEAEKYTRLLTRFSKEVVARLSEIYPQVFVATYPGNTRAIRWLEWLGFKKYERQLGNTLTMVKE